MATFKTFEDIDAWRDARILADRIFKLTIEGSFSKDFKLRDQINGSSGSIMDNIAEGFEREGNREFIQFLSIAKASAGETRSQLYRALDRNHITEIEFNSLKEDVLQISKRISGLIGYLKKSDLKGPKFVREPNESYGTPNLEL